MLSINSTSVRSVAKHMQHQLDTCINSDMQDQVSKRFVSFDFQGQNDVCQQSESHSLSSRMMAVSSLLQWSHM